MLAATDFFADADDRTLDALAAAGTVRQLVRGDVLFNEGDPPDALYLVTRGRIAIAIANPIDRRESVVALMEPGDLFGELGHARRPATLGDGAGARAVRACSRCRSRRC